MNLTDQNCFRDGFHPNILHFSLFSLFDLESQKSHKTKRDIKRENRKRWREKRRGPTGRRGSTMAAVPESSSRAPTSNIQVGWGRVAGSCPVHCHTLVFALIRLLAVLYLQRTCEGRHSLTMQLCRTASLHRRRTAENLWMKMSTIFSSALKHAP